jgi:hypothetical protein
MVGKATIQVQIPMLRCTLFDYWDQKSAYLYGFWLADGCIFTRYKNNKIYKYVSVGSLDEEAIIMFANEWGTLLNIRHIAGGLYYQTELWSEHLYDRCLELAGVTHKSKAEPRLPDIPTSLLPHFVRGFFDGDGSIYWVNSTNRHGNRSAWLQSSFTAGKGTGQFLHNLQNLLVAEVGVSRRKITGKHHQKLILGQYDTKLLCEWMYAEGTIFLSRKKAIWDAADKTKLAASIKYRAKT